jgi:hypothetical protein
VPFVAGPGMTVRSFFATVIRILCWPWRMLGVALLWLFGAIGLALVLVVLGNGIFHSPRDVPRRALDPTAPICQEGAAEGWDVLDRPAKGDYVANDEWVAIDRIDARWRQKFSCSIQRHALPGYKAPDESVRRLAYDLAFLEFQEDGKPYALRRPCEGGAQDCTDEGYGAIRRVPSSQLDALLARLGKPGPHYVLVFIHGWRHDGSIGDDNVVNIRHYAAHAARFIEDRSIADPAAPKPDVIAVFVGWRGARTDEIWLRHTFGAFGAAIGAYSAIPTLFDRKPVSEAVGPAVLGGLHAIEQTIGISDPLPPGLSTPAPHTSRMIVFGHSLGGNMLASALHDDLVKKVGQHQPGTTMLPTLGDLTVLINPASEATKWTDVQRAVWNRIATAVSERRPSQDYAASHAFFRADQRPIVMSVTAARDWPPGGLRETDCIIVPSAASKQIDESKSLVQQSVDYDWATNDLFPAFKFDVRPLADRLKRFATNNDPHDQCNGTQLSWARTIVMSPFLGLSALMRVFPFQETDAERTHTIGNYDPPRAPRGSLNNNYISAHPFGTTHELRGLDSALAQRKHNKPDAGEALREIPVDYNEIVSPQAACPPARHWLSKARAKRSQDDPDGHGTNWTSDDAENDAPALQFVHGFTKAGVKPITRANDPFWNMRAFDTALARHDGYMLSSFICAMNQLVMDDVTNYPPLPAFVPVPAVSREAE